MVCSGFLVIRSVISVVWSESPVVWSIGSVFNQKVSVVGSKALVEMNGASEVILSFSTGMEDEIIL